MVILHIMRKLNIVGQKYNKLTVLEEASPINGRTAWKCQCDCGKITEVSTNNLK